jgi:hypothetical protein
MVTPLPGGKLASAQGTAGTAGAFGTAFWWCLGLTVPGLAPALLLTGRRARRQASGGPGRRRPGDRLSPARRAA